MNTFIKINIILLTIILMIWALYSAKVKAGIELDYSRHAVDFLRHPSALIALAHAQMTSAVENRKPAETSKAAIGPARIRVDPQRSLGRVNRKILGMNLLGIYSSDKMENQHTDFGAGLWDSRNNQPVAEPMDLAKTLRVSTLRFPGGCGTHLYDWKKAVEKDRTTFLFGVDEFMEVAETLGAEPVFTLSYFTGGPQDAADLVEYLNAPATPGYPWALKRANKVRQEPYAVKYFELGNEVDHGDHQKIKEVSPQQYAADHLKYYEAMKEADPQVQLGVVLYDQKWNSTVMEIVRDKIDFGIVHIYPAPVWGKELETMPAEEIFSASLAIPVVQNDFELKSLRALLRTFTGRDVPVFVTEFNGGFVQDRPVPYRHSLGNALVNAEIIRVLMDPENNVGAAHYWNLLNEYWGLIANGFSGPYEELSRPYFKRPNYFTFELYSRYFGDELIPVEVVSPEYDIGQSVYYKELLRLHPGGKNLPPNLLNPGWIIYPVDGVGVTEEGDVLTLDFGDHRQWNYYHCLKTANVEPDTVYKLSGYIRTEKLMDESGVYLEVQDARGWEKTRAAAGTAKVKGDTGWEFVERLYKTLPGAQGAKVFARRAGDAGPLKGKASFKDVKLEKFVPDIGARLPYLSVNASRSADGRKIYLMVLNKNLDEEMKAMIDLAGFTAAPLGQARVLNGPGIDVTNEENHDRVKVTHGTFDIDGNKFEYTFEPHSLTALEIDKK